MPETMNDAVLIVAFHNRFHVSVFSTCVIATSLPTSGFSLLSRSFNFSRLLIILVDCPY